MNASADNFQPLLQVHALLPISIEHGQNEAGGVSMRAKVDLGKRSHVIHMVQRHSVLRIVSGQQEIGLIRTFSEGSGQLSILQCRGKLVIHTKSSQSYFARIYTYLTANIVGCSMSSQLNIIVQFVQSQVSLNIFIEVSTVCRNPSANQ